MGRCDASGTTLNSVASAADGAAYDPTTRAWHVLAAAPAGMAGEVGTSSAWTGDEAVFWAGLSLTGSPAAAAYRPATNAWRPLPVGPMRMQHEGQASVWTGTELLVMGGHSGDGYPTPVATALDPRTSRWRVLTAMSAYPGLFLAGAVWNGHLVYASGTYALCPQLGSRCTRLPPIFFAFDPATGVLHRLSLAGAPTGTLTPVGWAGSTVVFTVTTDGAPRIVRYTPATGTWTTGPTAPCPEKPNAFTQSVWFDGEYAVGCAPSALEIYDSGSDRWSVIPAGASPMSTRSGSAIVWTGTQLIAWSGTVDAPANPTPDDGSSIGCVTTAPGPGLVDQGPDLGDGVVDLVVHHHVGAQAAPGIGLLVGLGQALGQAVGRIAPASEAFLLHCPGGRLEEDQEGVEAPVLDLGGTVHVDLEHHVEPVGRVRASACRRGGRGTRSTRGSRPRRGGARTRRG